jgi:hypothetical protein
MKAEVGHELAVARPASTGTSGSAPRVLRSAHPADSDRVLRRGRRPRPGYHVSSLMTRHALLRQPGEFPEIRPLILTPICTDIPSRLAPTSAATRSPTPSLRRGGAGDADRVAADAEPGPLHAEIGDRAGDRPMTRPAHVQAEGDAPAAGLVAPGVDRAFPRGQARPATLALASFGTAMAHAKPLVTKSLPPGARRLVTVPPTSRPFSSLSLFTPADSSGPCLVLTTKTLASVKPVAVAANQSASAKVPLARMSSPGQPRRLPVPQPTAR